MSSDLHFSCSFQMIILGKVQQEVVCSYLANLVKILDDIDFSLTYEMAYCYNCAKHK